MNRLYRLLVSDAAIRYARWGTHRFQDLLSISRYTQIVQDDVQRYWDATALRCSSHFTFTRESILQHFSGPPPEANPFLYIAKLTT